MRRRIKQLISDAATGRSAKPIERVRPVAPRVEVTRELALEIKADVLARRTFTYEEAAGLLGCSAEKMRLEARGYPIIRSGRTHRIPECIFKLIVRDRGLEGMAVAVPAAPQPHPKTGH
jgi:hypothetical protein